MHSGRAPENIPAGTAAPERAERFPDEAEGIRVIGKITTPRGERAEPLIWYLYGPGRHEVLSDFQSRSAMLQLLTASLLNICSRVV
jgi:hypothetical protein